MGFVRANIELINAIDQAKADEGLILPSAVRRAKVEIPVDSGAYTLAINEALQAQLGLRSLGVRPAQMDDGSVRELEMVGPVTIQFANRSVNLDALVLPGENEMFLGVIPKEAMDVLIDPLRQELVVNPAHPMRPQYSLK